MLKLGTINTIYSCFGGFEEQVKRIKEQGYDCIDYQGFVVTDGNPRFEEMSLSEFSAAIKDEYEVLAKYGISASQVHAPWRYPPRDATYEEQSLRLLQMCRALEGAAILGAEYFAVHPIMPYSVDDSGFEIETLNANVNFLRKLCNAAAELGITVCLENMPMKTFSIASVNDTLGCIAAVGEKNLKLCLDTGHAEILGTSPSDAVKMIGRDQLAILHIHDNDGNSDMHMSPFDGVIDWHGFCVALAEIGFDGTLSLESDVSSASVQAAKKELAELKRKGDLLMEFMSVKR